MCRFINHGINDKENTAVLKDFTKSSISPSFNYVLKLWSVLVHFIIIRKIVLIGNCSKCIFIVVFGIRDSPFPLNIYFMIFCMYTVN